MPDVSLQDLQKILDFYSSSEKNDADEIIESWSTGNIETPFTIKPEEFQKFAEADLQIADKHHIVNGLSNVKRAIECQIDSLLFAFGLFTKAKNQNLNFPRKIQLLNEIGIVSPRILGKINQLRNLLEHEYSVPERERVDDALDVAILFINYTNKFLYGYFLEFDLNTYSVENQPLDNTQVTLDYQNSRIVFQERWFKDDGKPPAFIVDPNHQDYIKYLIWYIQIIETKVRS